MTVLTVSQVEVVVDETRILRGCNLAVEDGELLVLIGRSGSGKSSIIRAIAGLLPVAAGAVRFDGEDVTDVPTHLRDLGLVLQGDGLFPHHDVRSNIGFPLRSRKARPDDVFKRVMAEARALGVEHLLERLPGHLSAGQQQLVQIARAVVRRPRVLLMDEPLANVDIESKRSLRESIVTLQRGYGVTTVYATNDPVEAKALADRLGVVADGRIAQVGTPRDVRRAPWDRHTALLTGAVAFLDATVVEDSTGPVVVAGDVRLRGWGDSLLAAIGDEVTLGLRPEDVVSGSDFAAQIVSHGIEDRRPVVWLETGSGRVTSDTINSAEGATVGCSLAGGMVFDARGDLIVAVGR